MAQVLKMLPNNNRPNKKRSNSGRKPQNIVKRVSVPVGLEALMNDLTIAVLKVQPADITAFAYEHFEKALRLRDELEPLMDSTTIESNEKPITMESENVSSGQIIVGTDVQGKNPSGLLVSSLLPSAAAIMAATATTKSPTNLVTTEMETECKVIDQSGENDLDGKRVDLLMMEDDSMLIEPDDDDEALQETDEVKDLQTNSEEVEGMTIEVLPNESRRKRSLGDEVPGLAEETDDSLNSEALDIKTVRDDPNELEVEGPNDHHPSLDEQGVPEEPQASEPTLDNPEKNSAKTPETEEITDQLPITEVKDVHTEEIEVLSTAIEDPEVKDLDNSPEEETRDKEVLSEDYNEEVVLKEKSLESGEDVVDTLIENRLPEDDGSIEETAKNGEESVDPKEENTELNMLSSEAEAVENKSEEVTESENKAIPEDIVENPDGKVAEVEPQILSDSIEDLIVPESVSDSQVEIIEITEKSEPINLDDDATTKNESPVVELIDDIVPVQEENTKTEESGVLGIVEVSSEIGENPTMIEENHDEVQVEPRIVEDQADLGIKEVENIVPETNATGDQIIKEEMVTKEIIEEPLLIATSVTDNLSGIVLPEELIEKTEKGDSDLNTSRSKASLTKNSVVSTSIDSDADAVVVKDDNVQEETTHITVPEIENENNENTERSLKELLDVSSEQSFEGIITEHRSEISLEDASEIQTNEEKVVIDICDDIDVIMDVKIPNTPEETSLPRTSKSFDLAQISNNPEVVDIPLTNEVIEGIEEDGSGKLFTLGYDEELGELENRMALFSSPLVSPEEEKSQSPEIEEVVGVSIETIVNNDTPEEVNSSVDTIDNAEENNSLHEPMDSKDLEESAPKTSSSVETVIDDVSTLEARLAKIRSPSVEINADDGNNENSVEKNDVVTSSPYFEENVVKDIPNNNREEQLFEDPANSEEINEKGEDFVEECQVNDADEIARYTSDTKVPEIPDEKSVTPSEEAGDEAALSTTESNVSLENKNRELNQQEGVVNPEVVTPALESGNEDSSSMVTNKADTDSGVDQSIPSEKVVDEDPSSLTTDSVKVTDTEADYPVAALSETDSNIPVEDRDPENHQVLEEVVNSKAGNEDSSSTVTYHENTDSGVDQSIPSGKVTDEDPSSLNNTTINSARVTDTEADNPVEEKNPEMEQQEELLPAAPKGTNSVLEVGNENTPSLVDQSNPSVEAGAAQTPPLTNTTADKDSEMEHTAAVVTPVLEVRSEDPSSLVTNQQDTNSGVNQSTPSVEAGDEDTLSLANTTESNIPVEDGGLGIVQQEDVNTPEAGNEITSSLVTNQDDTDAGVDQSTGDEARNTVTETESNNPVNDKNPAINSQEEVVAPILETGNQATSSLTTNQDYTDSGVDQLTPSGEASDKAPPLINTTTDSNIVTDTDPNIPAEDKNPEEDSSSLATNQEDPDSGDDESPEVKSDSDSQQSVKLDNSIILDLSSLNKNNLSKIRFSNTVEPPTKSDLDNGNCATIKGHEIFKFKINNETGKEESADLNNDAIMKTNVLDIVTNERKSDVVQTENNNQPSDSNKIKLSKTTNVIIATTNDNFNISKINDLEVSDDNSNNGDVIHQYGKIVTNGTVTIKGIVKDSENNECFNRNRMIEEVNQRQDHVMFNESVIDEGIDNRLMKNTSDDKEVKIVTIDGSDNDPETKQAPNNLYVESNVSEKVDPITSDLIDNHKVDLIKFDVVEKNDKVQMKKEREVDENLTRSRVLMENEIPDIYSPEGRNDLTNLGIGEIENHLGVGENEVEELTEDHDSLNQAIGNGSEIIFPLKNFQNLSTNGIRDVNFTTSKEEKDVIQGVNIEIEDGNIEGVDQEESHKNSNKVLNSEQKKISGTTDHGYLIQMDDEIKREGEIGVVFLAVVRSGVNEEIESHATQDVDDLMKIVTKKQSMDQNILAIGSNHEADENKSLIHQQLDTNKISNEEILTNLINDEDVIEKTIDGIQDGDIGTNIVNVNNQMDKKDSMDQNDCNEIEDVIQINDVTEKQDLKNNEVQVILNPNTTQEPDVSENSETSTKCSIIIGNDVVERSIISKNDNRKIVKEMESVYFSDEDKIEENNLLKENIPTRNKSFDGNSQSIFLKESKKTDGIIMNALIKANEEQVSKEDNIFSNVRLEENRRKENNKSSIVNNFGETEMAEEMIVERKESSDLNEKDFKNDVEISYNNSDLNLTITDTEDEIIKDEEIKYLLESGISGPMGCESKETINENYESSKNYPLVSEEQRTKQERLQPFGASKINPSSIIKNFQTDKEDLMEQSDDSEIKDGIQISDVTEKEDHKKNEVEDISDPNTTQELDVSENSETLTNCSIIIGNDVVERQIISENDNRTIVKEVKNVYFSDEEKSEENNLLKENIPTTISRAVDGNPQSILLEESNKVDGIMMNALIKASEEQVSNQENISSDTRLEENGRKENNNSSIVNNFEETEMAEEMILKRKESSDWNKKYFKNDVEISNNNSDLNFTITDTEDEIIKDEEIKYLLENGISGPMGCESKETINVNYDSSQNYPLVSEEQRTNQERVQRFGASKINPSSIIKNFQTDKEDLMDQSDDSEIKDGIQISDVTEEKDHKKNEVEDISDPNTTQELDVSENSETLTNCSIIIGNDVVERQIISENDNRTIVKERGNVYFSYEEKSEENNLLKENISTINNTVDGYSQSIFLEESNKVGEIIMNALIKASEEQFSKEENIFSNVRLEENGRKENNNSSIVNNFGETEMAEEMSVARKESSDLNEKDFKNDVEISYNNSDLNLTITDTEDEIIKDGEIKYLLEIGISGPMGCEIKETINENYESSKNYPLVSEEQRTKQERLQPFGASKINPSSIIKNFQTNKEDLMEQSDDSEIKDGIQISDVTEKEDHKKNEVKDISDPNTTQELDVSENSETLTKCSIIIGNDVVERQIISENDNRTIVKEVKNVYFSDEEKSEENNLLKENIPTTISRAVDGNPQSILLEESNKVDGIMMNALIKASEEQVSNQENISSYTRLEENGRNENNNSLIVNNFEETEMAEEMIVERKESSDWIKKDFKNDVEISNNNSHLNFTITDTEDEIIKDEEIKYLLETGISGPMGCESKETINENYDSSKNYPLVSEEQRTKQERLQPFGASKTNPSSIIKNFQSDKEDLMDQSDDREIKDGIQISDVTEKEDHKKNEVEDISDRNTTQEPDVSENSESLTKCSIIIGNHMLSRTINSDIDNRIIVKELKNIYFSDEEKSEENDWLKENTLTKNNEVDGSSESIVLEESNKTDGIMVNALIKASEEQVSNEENISSNIWLEENGRKENNNFAIMNNFGEKEMIVERKDSEVKHLLETVTSGSWGYESKEAINENYEVENTLSDTGVIDSSKNYPVIPDPRRYKEKQQDSIVQNENFETVDGYRKQKEEKNYKKHQQSRIPVLRNNKQKSDDLSQRQKTNEHSSDDFSNLEVIKTDGHKKREKKTFINEVLQAFIQAKLTEMSEDSKNLSNFMLTSSEINNNDEEITTSSEKLTNEESSFFDDIMNDDIVFENYDPSDQIFSKPMLHRSYSETELIKPKDDFLIENEFQLTQPIIPDDEEPISFTQHITINKENEMTTLTILTTTTSLNSDETENEWLSKISHRLSSLKQTIGTIENYYNAHDLSEPVSIEPDSLEIDEDSLNSEPTYEKFTNVSFDNGIINDHGYHSQNSSPNGQNGPELLAKIRIGSAYTSDFEDLMEDEKEEIDVNLPKKSTSRLASNLHRVDSAIIKIQSRWRGYMVRRSIRKRYESVGEQQWPRMVEISSLPESNIVGSSGDVSDLNDSTTIPPPSSPLSSPIRHRRHCDHGGSTDVQEIVTSTKIISPPSSSLTTSTKSVTRKSQPQCFKCNSVDCDTQTVISVPAYLQPKKCPLLGSLITGSAPEETSNCIKTKVLANCRARSPNMKYSRQQITHTGVTDANNCSTTTATNENDAAAKIQAGFRGYKVRKEMKQVKEKGVSKLRRKSSTNKGTLPLTNSTNANQKVENKKGNSGEEDLRQKSATKIQAGIRGFLARKKVKDLHE